MNKQPTEPIRISEAAKLLGITRQAVDKAVRRHGISCKSLPFGGQQARFMSVAQFSKLRKKLGR